MGLSEIERVAAIEGIRQAKARYLRGVDMGDGALVRSVLAEECTLDYNGCCLDPATGTDWMPAMNVVLRRRDHWPLKPVARPFTVSVHHAHHADIEIDDEVRGRAITCFTDLLYMPEGAPYRVLTGYGFYHETYERAAVGWVIKTLRISRLRVEVA